MYTVIQTCKANGVDPQAYIADVTGKIAADWPAARWDELMPWNWAAQTVEPVAQAA
ncbi:transposase domain-containing protein [Sphingomonas sp. Leaf208]|uniref:transposase domain-containing protein n=1 Tax=Sphingomonas sp. Leaf208 TaxID=1735679 RepID=UPI0039DF46C5